MDEKHKARTQSVRDPVWTKIVSFALWIWLSNILINLFAICDRLLIVNYASASIAEGQALVGQYHSSRILPLLLVSVGGMAGSMMTPYLSHDWEASRRDVAQAKLNTMLKSMAILCYGFSLFVLLLAPLFFSGIWKDKFANGEAMLPLTLTYCTWAALTLVAQKYFWCIERTWLSSCALLFGLTINVTLGLLFLPGFGMQGVVVATLIAHLCVLANVYWLCARWGMALDKSIVWLSLLPVLLCCGSVASIVGLVTVLAFTVSGEHIYRNSEKAMLCAGIVSRSEKLRQALARMNFPLTSTDRPGK